jgi:hypothetical protein
LTFPPVARDNFVEKDMNISCPNRTFQKDMDKRKKELGREMINWRSPGEKLPTLG